MPNAKPSKKKNLKKHGILIVHGAGMPTEKKGDTLTWVANGLVDHLSQDKYLSENYHVAVKGEVKDRIAETLDVNVYDKKSGTLAFDLRFREAPWRPTILKQSLLSYISFIWLWAFAFQSHFSRKTKLDANDRGQGSSGGGGSGDVKGMWDAIEEKPEEKKKRRDKNNRGQGSFAGGGPWDLKGMRKAIEANPEEKKKRRDQDFLSRTLIAILGFLLSIPWAIGARSILLEKLPSWFPGLPSFGLGILTNFDLNMIYVSIVAALVLFFSAISEWSDRNTNRAHGRLHMLCIIITTAWLSLFLVPVLFIMYFLLDRFLTKIVIALFIGTAILLTPQLRVWQVAWLTILAAGIVIIVRMSELDFFKDLYSKRIARAARNALEVLATLITTLLVITGAPIVIVVIQVLELLGIIPFVGEKTKEFAKSISESSGWELVREIHMFLTDSTRAAAARRVVEDGIAELAKETEQVHIFAHSLGSAVAYDTLAHIGRGEGAVINRRHPAYRKIKTLVTFGSPLNKMRLLADRTKDDEKNLAGFDRNRFNERAALSPKLGGIGGFRWVNVYSLYDVVSDICSAYSSGPVLPHEFSAWSANRLDSAHDMYPMDPGFCNIALEAIGEVYPGGEMLRIEKLDDGFKGLLIEAMREGGIASLAQFKTQIENKDVRDAVAKRSGEIVDQSHFDDLSERAGHMLGKWTEWH